MASGRGSSSREGTAKAAVSEQISQAILSTSNLLILMQQSSPSQARLAKLPRNLFEKTDTIRNTGQVLEQLPLVISSLDAHIESGLHSAPRLKTVIQLLGNMESSHLNSFSEAQPDGSSKVLSTLPQSLYEECGRIYTRDCMNFKESEQQVWSHLLEIIVAEVI